MAVYVLLVNIASHNVVMFQMHVFLFDLDDKLTRVQPLIDHVRRVSQHIFQPYEKTAVDERMVRSKHKFSGIRQFLKNKPVKLI